MNLSDTPPISFFQRVHNPVVVIGTLYLCSMLFHERFSGYSLVLMVLAFFISLAVDRRMDYRAWHSVPNLAYVRDIILGWCITIAVLIFLASASGLAIYYDERVVLAWFVATPFTMLASHITMRRVAGWQEKKSSAARSVVVIGANDVGIKFAAICDRHSNLCIQIRGFFDDRADKRHPAAMRHPILGTMTEIVAFVCEQNIKIIFISQPMSAQARIRKLLDELQDTTASVYFLPDIYSFDLMQARSCNFGGMPVIAICETPFIGLNRAIKRAIDIVFCLAILVLLAPVMLAVALVVKLTSPGPMIFRQRRYGLNGEEIIVYKFRSMTVTDDGGTIVQACKGDLRLTPVGAFLRRTSLDELPQFVNVLQGRMSIVGPRPHAVAHNELYRKLIKGYMLRHKVKPGITGWAQVNGMRGETATIDEMKARIEFDLYYLRNWSVLLDLRIILKTVRAVIGGDNAH